MLIFIIIVICINLEDYWIFLVIVLLVESLRVRAERGEFQESGVSR